MEEFKRAHQKMFNSAQQKTQFSEQVPKETQEKVRENKFIYIILCIYIYIYRFILKIAQFKFRDIIKQYSLNSEIIK